jgi:hypothetical protein
VNTCPSIKTRTPDSVRSAVSSTAEALTKVAANQLKEIIPDFISVS